jgi:hypothetical protein
MTWATKTPKRPEIEQESPAISSVSVLSESTKPASKSSIAMTRASTQGYAATPRAETSPIAGRRSCSDIRNAKTNWVKLLIICGLVFWCLGNSSEGAGKVEMTTVVSDTSGSPQAGKRRQARALQKKADQTS